MSWVKIPLSLFLPPPLLSLVWMDVVKLQLELKISTNYRMDFWIKLQYCLKNTRKCLHANEECIQKWKFIESEIKQTLRIALFIIVYRPARVERNSNASNQLNACNVLITATIFGKQNVNINKNNLILLGLRSCISKMKKYQGNVDFNIQCPRVKKMNWHGNTIEMCLSSRTYTCVRVCVCKTNHKSLFISLCDACFVWIALCNSWKTLKWLVVRLYCSFFSAFSFSVRTSKPKWTASIGRERETRNFRIEIAASGFITMVSKTKTTHAQFLWGLTFIYYCVAVIKWK